MVSAAEGRHPPPRAALKGSLLSQPQTGMSRAAKGLCLPSQHSQAPVGTLVRRCSLKRLLQHRVPPSRPSCASCLLPLPTSGGRCRKQGHRLLPGCTAFRSLTWKEKCTLMFNCWFCFHFCLFILLLTGAHSSFSKNMKQLTLELNYLCNGKSNYA